MLGSGFVSKIPKDAATSSGLQNYDNVLVDTHANERLLIGGGILQLKNPHNAAKGEVGLSDHYPVFVEVCEVQKTGKQPAPEPLPVVESELVEEEVEEPPPPLEPVLEEEPPPPPPPPLEYKQFAPGDHHTDWDGVEPSSDEDLDSDALTDGPPELPRGSDDDEKPPPPPEDEEAAVQAVVHAAMAQVEHAVVERAATSPAEAPPAAAPSTEAPPSSPPPPPAPAPEAPPTSSVPELTLDEEIEAVLGPEHRGPALPPELTTQASASDPELSDELEAARLEWEVEDELARDLPEED
jgi:hypothetical protein